MNYLFLLPDDLINLIFEKCGEKSLNSSPLDVFIKFKYMVKNVSCVSCTYMEYTGIMEQNNITTQNVEIISCTSYLDNIPTFLLKHIDKINSQNVTIQTIWLYRPLLYIFKKYTPIFIS